MMRKKMLMGMMCLFLTATTACGGGNGGSKEKPKTKDGKTIVTLSITYANQYLKAVEKKFEQKYPEIDLQIQHIDSSESGPTEAELEKYLKTTNAAILAGQGADIIELSTLPVNHYVEKKLLTNMNDTLEVDQTLNKNDLNMNILNGMRQSGGLYAIPSSYFVGAFVSDGDILDKKIKVDENNWTWDQFVSVSNQFIQQDGRQGGRYALANYAPEEFLKLVVKNNSADYIDQASLKAKFDSPAFINQLQQVKKMYDDKILTADQAKLSNQLFYHTYLFSPLDFYDQGFRFYKNGKLLPTPHSPGDAGGTTFLVPNQYGIQANSPVKDEAWKFLAYMMSEEAQSLVEREGLEGFSLSKSVNDKLLSDMEKFVKSSEWTGENASSIKDRHFKQVRQLVASANRFASADDKLLSIVMEEAKSYFSGQKSAEEVAKLIQNRTTTYLNE